MLTQCLESRKCWMRLQTRICNLEVSVSKLRVGGLLNFLDQQVEFLPRGGFAQFQLVCQMKLSWNITYAVIILKLCFYNIIYLLLKTNVPENSIRCRMQQSAS